MVFGKKAYMTEGKKFLFAIVLGLIGGIIISCVWGTVTETACPLINSFI